MSRIAAVLDAVVTINAPSVVATVPSTHKYEVLGISFNTDSTAAVTFLVLRSSAGGFFARDEVAHPAGRFTSRRDYTMMTFVDGDSIVVYPLTAGTPACSVVVDFIDVDY